MTYKTNIYTMVAILLFAAVVGIIANAIVPHSAIPVAVIVAYVLFRFVSAVDKSFKL